MSTVAEFLSLGDFTLADQNPVQVQFNLPDLPGPAILFYLVTPIKKSDLQVTINATIQTHSLKAGDPPSWFSAVFSQKAGANQLVMELTKPNGNVVVSDVGVFYPSVGTQTFVFRPGGVQQRNVYTSWPDMMAAIDSVEGRKFIEIDDTIQAPAVIPAGTWNMRDVVLGGFGPPPGGGSPRCTAEISEGCVFTNLRMIGHVTLINKASNTIPISDLQPDEHFQIGMRDDAGNPHLINQGGIEMIAAPAGVNFRCQNALMGTGTAPFNSTFPLIKCVAPTGPRPVLIIGLGQCSIGKNLVTGLAGQRVQFVVNSTAMTIGREQLSITNGNGTFDFGMVGRIQRRLIPIPPAAAIASQAIGNPNALVLGNGTGNGFQQNLSNMTTGFVQLGDEVTQAGQEVGVVEVAGGSNLRVAPAAGDTIMGSPAAIPIPPRTSLIMTANGVSDWLPIASSGGMPGAFALIGEISPPALPQGLTQDYAPADLDKAAAIRVTANAAGSTLGGLAGGMKGRIIIIHNVGSVDLTIGAEAAASVAANRFALTQDIVIHVNGSATFRYDSTTLRWRCTGTAL